MKENKSTDQDKAIEQVLIEYAKKNSAFTAEDVWNFVKDNTEIGVEPNRRGPLFKKFLLTPGHVMGSSFTTAKNKQANGRAVILWKSLLCKSSMEAVSSKDILNGIKTKIHLREITLMEGLIKAYEAGMGLNRT